MLTLFVTHERKPILTLTKNKGKLVGFVFLVVQQTLARAWRQPFLNFTEVKQRLMGTVVHEKLISIPND